MVKINAWLAEIIPLGISLIAVLGFFASKFLSKYLLKDIAALRAVIMQRITRINLPDKSAKEPGTAEKIFSCGLVCHPGSISESFFLQARIPKKKPIRAKGIAKMVWLNFIRFR
jgi:hypothetical protein